MKKEERLQQQCDVCGRLLDKNISNFRKYSRKTNGLNFHTTCRDCEDRIKLNTEWKDGKLLKAQNGKCAISGLDMTYELGEGRIYTNVSIDQIMPSKGYTIDNIQLVCMAVNQLKSDLDMDTILILCSAIVDNAAKWKH